MSHDSFFKIMFVAVFAAVAGSLLFKIVKYGGFRAALFGAPIRSTLGEVPGANMKFGSVVVRVHALAGGSMEKAVGVEFVAKTFASYQMLPVALSTSDAAKLADLLRAAASENRV